MGCCDPAKLHHSEPANRGMHYTNPGSTNPIINHTAGAVGILSLRDWDINTQSSSFTIGVDLAGGTVSQFALSGTNWNDAGTGHLVGGSVVPTFITCSSYAGPNRLLASGFAPSIQNGDCFTNTYGSSVPTAIHFWPMNEGTGSTLHDSIGSTNLTATNVTWATSTGMGTSAVAQFNGTSSFASAASVDSTLNFNGTQPMTVCYGQITPRLRPRLQRSLEILRRPLPIKAGKLATGAPAFRQTFWLWVRSPQTSSP